MKLLHFTFLEINLCITFALYFLFGAAHGLDCYTCGSFTGVDGDLSSRDKFCEFDVTSSPNLLQTCDEAPPGKEAICVQQLFKAHPWESKLTMFTRSCLYVRKGTISEDACVGFRPRSVLKDIDTEEYNPKVIRVLQQTEAPWVTCFCTEDGCNNNNSQRRSALRQARSIEPSQFPVNSLWELTKPMLK